MGAFSFKSSGRTQADINALPVATLQPIGILTPLTLGSDDLLTTSTDLGIQLGDNLRNLIMTNWGERLGFYNFGANLRPLMSEMASQEDFDSAAIARIRTAVSTWMPYIDLQDFLSETDRTQNRSGGLAVVNLTITYDIPSLNVRGKKLQVQLWAM